MTFHPNVFAQGLLLQASLILALGAQNIFVLNAGLRRERHLLVAAVASMCDALLVFTGVLGVATIFSRFPLLKVALGLVGVGFLSFYGILKVREAKNGVTFTKPSENVMTTRRAILTTLGFSLLNPHVYLDTIVLIGGYSSKFEDFGDRFDFGAGASAGSAIWFFGLALSASQGGRLLNSPRAMRAVSLISGVILLILALRLGNDVLGWMVSHEPQI